MRAFYLKLLSFVFFIAIPGLANATNSRSCSVEKKTNLTCIASIDRRSKWYLDVGLGTMFKQKLGTFNLLNSEELPDKYNTSSIQHADVALLSGGYVWSRSTSFLPFVSLGLEYARFFSGKISGFIEDYSSHEDINFGYHYQLSHHNLHLLGKANLYCWRGWMPYIVAGIGMSWNQLTAYDENNLSMLYSEHANPYFPNKVKSNLSYSLGVGVDYQLTKNIWSGFGYRYNNFGQITSGESVKHFSEGQFLKDRNSGYDLFFSLRYIFS